MARKKCCRPVEGSLCSSKALNPAARLSARKMIHDHRKDLERQIAAHASDIGPQPQQCPSLEYLLLTAEARARHVPQVGVS